MNKNILVGIIIVLAVICVAEGFFIVHERNAKIAAMNYAARRSRIGQQPPRGKPMLVLKGQNFMNNPLFSRAYLIFPTSGTLSSDAQKAMAGWTMNTTANSDGSTQVDLIPKEAEDVKQSFTVKQGYKLYFIELTLSDDQTGVDLNRADDIGVLVDPNGIVQ